MRQQAYLVKGLRISVIDARDTREKLPQMNVFYFRELGLNVPSMSFYFEGGLQSLVKFQNQSSQSQFTKIFSTLRKNQ
jgi:DNA gyrase/topoisomerase IV subunit B